MNYGPSFNMIQGIDEQVALGVRFDPISAAIGGGLGLVGGIIGSSKQSDAIESAGEAQARSADAATQAQLSMFNTARRDYRPFQEAGVRAVPLLDYLATGNTTGYDYDAYDQALEQYNTDFASYENAVSQYNRPMFTEVSDAETGEYSPGYMASLAQRITRPRPTAPTRPNRDQFAYDISGQDLPERFPEQKYIGQIENLPRDEGQYINALSALNPEISIDLESDPIYQAQKEELLRTLGNKYSARGINSSSFADDALVRNVLPLMQASYGRGVDLYGRQSNQLNNLYGLTSDFNRDSYNRLSGLYGLASDIGNRQYGRTLDLTKIGAGAASSAGQGALSTGTQLSNIQLQKGQDAANNALLYGQNQSNLYSNLFNAPMQMYNAYSFGNSLNSLAPGSAFSTNPAPPPTGYPTPASYYRGYA